MVKNFIRLGILITALSVPSYYMVKAGNIHLERRINSQVSVNAYLEEGKFEYEGSVYKITNEKKHRVELVKSRLLREYDKKCYEQEAYVYDGDVKYSVYSIGYKAFSEDGTKAKVQVKLPSTVRELKSECMGVNIVKLDLSETKVKTIPSYLFVTYEGTNDITPVINEIILPKTCKKIAGYAFNKCDNIKKMTIPEKVTKIGCYAIGKTCGELIFEGKVPGGMVNQKMKKTVIRVKTDYYIDALELLIKPVSLGRCEVREVE